MGNAWVWYSALAVISGVVGSHLIDQIALYPDSIRKLKHAKEEEERRQEEEYESDSNINQSGTRGIAERLHAIFHQLHAQKKQQKIHENGRASRERITIGALIAAGTFALISDLLLGCQLRDARDIADIQHGDTQTALNLADTANKTAKATAAAQIKEMSAQTEAMQLQARLIQTQLTPRLDVALDFGEQGILNGVPVRGITPHWTNSGPTEAREWAAWDSFAVFHGKLPEAADLQQYQGDLFSATLAKQMMQTTLFISEEQVKAVANGEGAIIFWGYGQWHDVFDRTVLHYQRYCFRLFPVQTNTGAVAWTLPSVYKPECNSSGDK